MQVEQLFQQFQVTLLCQEQKKVIDSIFTDKSKGETPFEEAEVDDTKTTISNSLANTYANQLYSAMKNSGTNEDMIYAIFKKIEKKMISVKFTMLMEEGRMLENLQEVRLPLQINGQETMMISI